VGQLNSFTIDVTVELYDASMSEWVREPTPDPCFNPLRLRTQLLLAIATSIDALAVGISFACTGYDRLSQLPLPLTIIGLTSFVLSLVGYALGRRFGKVITRRLKPELFGGIILILIGLKILLTS
jgi:putative Mn2+ efflux pump MntP